jgi:hypothetical protein
MKALFGEMTNLSEVQKREFLEALWSIVIAFVDMGFGVHPVQSVYSDLQEGHRDMVECLAGNCDCQETPKHKNIKMCSVQDES